MKFFKSLLKKLKCEHDYRNIDTDYRVYANHDSGRYEMATYYILYCPKCNREKRVNAEKYDRNLVKKKLRKQYE